MQCVQKFVLGLSVLFLCFLGILDTSFANEVEFESINYKEAPVFYKRAGTGDPILFLHNGGASHTIWRHLFKHFQATHDVIAVDLPGYGKSSLPESGYTLAQYVEFVEFFVETLNLPRLTLVGNCMGSAISLLYSEKHPENVSALILFNPLSERTFSGGVLSSLRSMDRFAWPAFNGLASVMKHIPVSDFAASKSLAMQLGTAGRQNPELRKDCDLKKCYRRPRQILAMRRLLSEIPRFAAVDQLVPGDHFPPICTIWGSQNRILSPQAGLRLNDSLKPAKAFWFENSGHLPMLEEPDRAIAAIEASMRVPGQVYAE